MIFCIVLLLTTALLALSGIGIDYYFNVRRKAKKAIPKIGNKLKAFDKIKRVIESCITLEQLVHSSNMIAAFRTLYHDDSDPTWHNDIYSRELNNLFFQRRNEIEEQFTNLPKQQTI